MQGKVTEAPLESSPEDHGGKGLVRERAPKASELQELRHFYSASFIRILKDIKGSLAHKTCFIRL